MPQLICFCAFGIATVLLAQSELPKSDSVDALDIEPPLLIKDGKPVAKPEPNSPEQLAASLERARRNAAGSDRLVKAGIIAKAEAEQRALKVVRLEFDLANARLQQAKDDYAARAQRLEAGEATKADVEQAGAALNAAEQAAKVAQENRDRAELEQAKVNVERQKKLLALGAAHQSDVEGAQQKVQHLLEPKE